MTFRRKIHKLFRMGILSDNTDQTYLEHLSDEYNNLKNLVFKYDEAISALLTGGHASYQIDTGQTMQRVTRLDLAMLQEKRDIAENKLNTLALRLRKTAGVVQAVPRW